MGTLSVLAGRHVRRSLQLGETWVSFWVFKFARSSSSNTAEKAAEAAVMSCTVKASYIKSRCTKMDQDVQRI